MSAEEVSMPRPQRPARPYEQIVIEAVSPSVDGGRHPVKGIVGDVLPVEATVYRHGHERVLAALQWQGPGDRAIREAPLALVNPGLDRWRGELRLERVGRYRFAVTGWTDVYGSWVEELGKRVRTAQPDVASEIAEGIALVDVERERAEVHRFDGQRVAQAIAPGAGAYECVEPVNRFVDLVKGDPVANNSDAGIALRTVEVLDAAYRSAASGRLERV